MRKVTRLKSLCLIMALQLLFVNVAFASQKDEGNEKSNHVKSNEIIVKFKNGQSELAKNKLIKKHGADKIKTKKKFNKSEVELIETINSNSMEEILAELQADTDVLYAQPNYEIHLSSTPNDEKFNQQWALNNVGQTVNGTLGTEKMDISAVSAWNVTKGSSSVIVGILDTGIDIEHEDLSRNIWVNSKELPGNGVDDDNNGYTDDVTGWNFIDENAVVYSTSSEDKHGTHIAGIIGAVSNNNIGISGVAPQIKLMPLKFVKSGIGYTSDAIEAIQYAEDNGASIINCSWWTSEKNYALREAMADSKMLFVAASGNLGSNNDISPVYPANYGLENIISVAAYDNKGNLANFSNYGAATVDIAAPGTDIISTVPENGYDYMSGTSMAAAHVSGVAALIKSNEATYNAAQIRYRIRTFSSDNPLLNEKVLNSKVLNATCCVGNQQVTEPVQDDNNEGEDGKNDNTNDTETPKDTSAEYAKLKAQRALTLSSYSDAQVSTLGYSSGKMFNDYIEYYVRPDGRFTLGTTGGDPDNPNDNYKKLTYGHPGSSTSFTTIRINGSDYVYSANSQVPTPNESNLSNTSEHKVEGVSIKQVLSIVKNASTQRDDIVEVKYIVSNYNSVSKNIGIRIMFDTMLGGNDGAPFRIPGIGSVTKELELSGESIPEYWQAFDNLMNPAVISNGSLLRSTDNRPDKVQFAYWGDIVGTYWNYTVNSNKYLTSDSAVALYWDQETLVPGETREYVTHYGLSEFIQDLRPPLAVSITGASSVEAEESGYNPNPFTVTAYIMDNGTGDANNVKAKVVLNDGLKLASGQQAEINLGTIAVGKEKQASWKVEVEPTSTAKNITYSVVVSADGVASKTLSKTVHVPPSNSISPIDTATEDLLEIINNLMNTQNGARGY